MTLLVNLPFVDTFTFRRGSSAPCRNEAGVVVTIGLNVPRFDHTEDGQPRGLLVEGRTSLREADQVRAIDGDWTARPGTVLHAYQDAAGGVIRTAWYSNRDHVSAVDACLNVQGHHQLIAFVPGFLPNLGGEVRWRKQVFALGGVLLSQSGAALGSSPDNLFLEG